MTALAGVGLGSNQGDKTAQIEAALEALSQSPGIRVLKVSRMFETEPVGFVDQDWFVNAAALIETDLEPLAVLERLLAVEQEMGRVRIMKWGPRLIDLDLLFYDDRIMDVENLTLPHPLMHERLFVLEPLAEVAPDWVHPVSGLTPGQMAAGLDREGQEVTSA